MSVSCEYSNAIRTCQPRSGNVARSSSTKAAVICLTKALAKEVAGKGDISALPPAVQCKIFGTMANPTVDYLLSNIPMGRLDKVEEVAALVYYLASGEASFTTRHVL